jgi:Na+-translocating ferredoxin:NAD+ oxidoreductase subunit A
MNSAQVASIAVSAIFVQNIVLIYMLCDGSYFKALKSPVSGFLYGIFVTASMTVASMLAWVVNTFLLRPFSLAWLSPFVFILIIVLIEIAAEFIVAFAFPNYKRALRKLLPVSAFNCAVLGLVFLNIQVNMRGFWGATLYGFCAGIGYLGALFIAANALERIRFSSPPNVFKGLPIALVTASLISLAFMGFTRIVILY